MHVEHVYKVSWESEKICRSRQGLKLKLTPGSRDLKQFDDTQDTDGQSPIRADTEIHLSVHC